MVNIPQRLNRHGSVALYHQLKRILRSRIASGEFQENQQLPSESELASAYEVSRHVVRQALKALVAEGRIVSYQGSGYFVNQKRYRKALLSLGSHTESMRAMAQPTTTIVTRKEILQPPEFIAEKLLKDPEEQAVFIQRVSFLNNEPVCVLEAYYPINYQSALLEANLDDKSIYNLLDQSFGLKPGRAETVISVIFADEDQSALMQIREGAPLLHIGSFTWTTEGELFEYSSNAYRSDRFELEMQQT